VERKESIQVLLEDTYLMRQSKRRRAETLTDPAVLKCESEVHFDYASLLKIFM
jgi:hypothetical protein